MDYIFTTCIFQSDGGKFYHDICGMLFPVSGHWTRLRAASSCADRIWHASGQSVSGYHENCGGGRCGRQYISGTFALFLSGRRVGHMAVTDLPWCRCHDRLWTADRQSCQLPFGSSSTVWYFLCLYWRYVSWI